MLQHQIQIVSSPARLGLTNPNSPSLQNHPPATPPNKPLPPPQPSPAAATSSSTITVPSSASASTTLLPLLPPLPRAQSLLIQMASLATRLFEASPNRSLWLAAFRGTLPTFLSSQTQGQTLTQSQTHESTKEILSLFTSLQTQLFEAVAQLQEILDLQDAKNKLAREIRSKDAAALAFTRQLSEAERVLDVLVDDYSDYRRPKRPKPDEEATEFDDDSSLSSAGPTTVSSQLNLTDILSYAHKISYTTFAPPEFGAGNAPLRGALPPAPQEEQMRSSQLYNLASLDVGLPKAEESEPMIEPLPAQPPAELNPLAKLNITVPSGWKPGMPVELPIEIPVPPPGWKPGDPVPLPAMASILLPRVGEQQLRSKPAEPIQVRPVQLDILDQDDDSSDYSSDEGSSDDDD